MLWILFAALVFAIWMTVYVYLQCFHSPSDRVEDPYVMIPGNQYEAVENEILECIRIMDKAPCEHIYTTSHDGLKLHARFYHTNDNAPTAIVLHGYKGNALRDGAGGFALSRQMGFNVLIPDQRSHAKSEGNVITFVIRERFDCMKWIEFVNAQFGVRPVLLMGLSMGAATVLMASELDLPDNVVGIIADAPYSSPAGIIRKVCTERGFPEKLVFPFICLAAKCFGRFSVKEASAVNAVKLATIPILLLHGTDDRFVPYQMSQQIAANCKDLVTLELFPGAGHGLCYMTDPDRYEAVIVQFLRNIPQLIPYLGEGNL